MKIYVFIEHKTRKHLPFRYVFETSTDLLSFTEIVKSWFRKEYADEISNYDIVQIGMATSYPLSTGYIPQS